MPAAANGRLGSTGTITSTSGNYYVHTGAGIYDITFGAASGLNGSNLNAYPLVATLNGSGSTGFVAISGGTGTLHIETLNPNGITLSDRNFSFTLYKP